MTLDQNLGPEYQKEFRTSLSVIKFNFLENLVLYERRELEREKLLCLTSNLDILFSIYLQTTGLPHTQRTQGIQGIIKLKKISGNFYLFFKIRETQGSFDLL